MRYRRERRPERWFVTSRECGEQYDSGKYVANTVQLLLYQINAFTINYYQDFNKLQFINKGIKIG